MTLRERLADWISGGAISDLKRCCEAYEEICETQLTRLRERRNIIAKLIAERQKLDRRIYNQRAELAFWNLTFTQHLWGVFRSHGITSYAEHKAHEKVWRDKWWAVVKKRNAARATPPAAQPKEGE